MNAFVLLLAGAALAAGAPAAPLDPNRDYHSYANTQAWRAEHLVLDLTADFKARALRGTAELRLKNLDAASRELVLDSRDLRVVKIETATPAGEWLPTTFKLGPADAILGSALHVTMPAGAERVRVHYATQPQASGLQWLTPEQTADKRHPFLFSQSQAIHARSWIPLQDTPQARMTFDARIRTPKPLLAVMAAEMETKPKRDGDFTFRMPQPIPSYLIALAVGDLRFKALGPRTGVYAEPALIKDAAAEFVDTEKMLEVNERLFGPYRWGRYDLLVLPPSFPYGGMENPRLTFISPSGIAGDKSLVSLIAHELAHSWSGNLVTNATWRDFWLNEGFTNHLTYRIMEVVYGQRRGDIERAEGVIDLQKALGEVEKPADRALAVDGRGRNPDDLVSAIPYERGALFLHYLESKFGRERLDAFLRRWFDEHAFGSVTTEQFLEYLQQHLLSTQPERVSKEKVAEWVYGEPLPADAVLPTSPAFAEIDAVRDAWLQGSVRPGAMDTAAWSAQEWQYFLEKIPAPVPAENLAALDKAFKFTPSRNAFIARNWFRVAIANHYEPALPALERYLMRVGRMRLIEPLYRELAKSDWGRAFAERVYAKARSGYHPIAQASIDKILGVVSK